MRVAHLVRRPRADYPGGEAGPRAEKAAAGAAGDAAAGTGAHGCAPELPEQSESRPTHRKDDTDAPPDRRNGGRQLDGRPGRAGGMNAGTHSLQHLPAI
jgi:hypothetical protein